METCNCDHLELYVEFVTDSKVIRFNIFFSILCTNAKVLSPDRSLSLFRQLPSPYLKYLLTLNKNGSETAGKLKDLAQNKIYNSCATNTDNKVCMLKTTNK